MFKRVRWMGIGALAGVGASAWAQHRLRQTLQEHPTIQSGADMVAAARRARREVAAALTDGRQAMVAREADLRADLAARRRPAGPPGQLPAARPSGAVPWLHVVDTTSSDPRTAS